MIPQCMILKKSKVSNVSIKKQLWLLYYSFWVSQYCQNVHLLHIHIIWPMYEILKKYSNKKYTIVCNTKRILYFQEPAAQMTTGYWSADMAIFPDEWTISTYLLLTLLGLLINVLLSALPLVLHSRLSLLKYCRDERKVSIYPNNPV